MKNIGVLFFIIPFILTTLSVQAFVGKFISVSISQLIAYGNIAMVVVGILFIIKEKNREPFPTMVKLWLFFYAFYYAIGLWGNIIHDNDAPLLKSIIPIFYFVGFSFFLGIKKNRRIFENVLVFTFTAANLLLIYFNRINFSMDYDGLVAYSLDRAGGVYGDANNAAVVCLLSFVFIYHSVKPNNILQKVLKIAGLSIALYSLFLTFSKTGFIVLLIVSVLLFYRFFNPRRVLALVFTVPIALYLLVQGALNSPNLTTVQKTRIQDVVNIITINTTEVSYSDRDSLFQNLLYYINENPILGNGIHFSNSISGHNTIFGIWADAGLFAFLLFLFLLLSYVRKAMSSSAEIKFYSLSILAVLSVFMLTLQTILDQAYLITVFVYLCYLVEGKDKSQVTNEIIST